MDNRFGGVANVQEKSVERTENDAWNERSVCCNERENPAVDGNRIDQSINETDALRKQWLLL